MRKPAAILLLGLLLFNWIGFRWLNDVMEETATGRLDAQIDRQQYNEDQLITLKVRVNNLSYFNSSPIFERVSGEIEIGGVPYRYVNRRIFNDSLEVQCIPNQAAFQVRRTGADYFQLVNDIGQNTKPVSHSHKTFSTDPFTCIEPLRMAEIFYTVVPTGFHCYASLPTLTLPTEERPPASPVV